jgi:cob(I)alamin adenosyltransferase
MREKKPHLLVLDEVGLAAHWKMLDVEDLLRLLKKVPAETTVVMTGRMAPKELIERADFVNEVTQVKMPRKFELTEGIQY